MQPCAQQGVGGLTKHWIEKEADSKAQGGHRTGVNEVNRVDVPMMGAVENKNNIEDAVICDRIAHTIELLTELIERK